MKRTLALLLIATLSVFALISCDHEITRSQVKPTKGETDGHAWVQLWKDGPRWAEFNVGSTITSYENITSYSDVGGTYKWGATSTSANESTSTTDIQGTNHDTAKVIWGDNWQMPTKEDFDNLVDSTNTTWTWCDGSTTQFAPGCTLLGFKVSGKGDYGDNSIFLPVQEVGIIAVGAYWSTMPIDENNSFYLFLDSGYQRSTGLRDSAFFVRAILNE